MASNTVWRIPPVGWLVLSLALAAEALSNGLRAYGLGSHLDHFTVHVQGYTVSLAGAVLVMAAVAVSLSQARAAWVALTPGRPARQRVVAGLATVLLLAVSVTAMALHILDAQRAKIGDEAGSAKAYQMAADAYDRAAKELSDLGDQRPVSVIQAEVQATTIDMRMWRRSDKCADITRDDTKAACAPILKLYKERGAAARKAELEPEVARLRDELAAMQKPKAESTLVEATVGLWWAWIMGAAVVLLATFGSVIFATAEVKPASPAPAPAPQALQVETEVETTSLPPSGGARRPLTRDEALEDLRLMAKIGHAWESQEELCRRWGRDPRTQKGTVSNWLKRWDEEGLLPGNRVMVGRCKTLASAD